MGISSLLILYYTAPQKVYQNNNNMVRGVLQYSSAAINMCTDVSECVKAPYYSWLYM